MMRVVCYQSVGEADPGRRTGAATRRPSGGCLQEIHPILDVTTASMCYRATVVDAAVYKLVTPGPRSNGSRTDARVLYPVHTLLARFCAPRDKEMVGRASLENLSEVDRRFGLGWPRPLFRRCLACNVPLEPAPEPEVERRVPRRVRERESEFRRCPSCERISWEGSHTRRMRRLEEALGGGESPRPCLTGTDGPARTPSRQPAGMIRSGTEGVLRGSPSVRSSPRTL